LERGPLTFTQIQCRRQIIQNRGPNLKVEAKVFIDFSPGKAYRA